MRHSSLSSRLYDTIERYRANPNHDHDVCRFEPTCSAYAQQALRSRSLPVAVLLIANRLLRCNPLVRRGTADPIVWTRRRPRPNAIASLLALLTIASGLALMGVAIAEASPVSGGCTAKLNGADPAGLTAEHPLVVHKGEAVTLSGTVPASAASLPKNQLTSTTRIKVAIVDGLYSNTTVRQGIGPQWGGSVNVDKYLKYGVGLYRVSGTASGSPNWTCSGDAYVRLEDGSPLGKPIGQVAAGLVVVGTAGGFAATQAGKPSDEEMQQQVQYDADTAGTPAEPQTVYSNTDTWGGVKMNLGCLATIAFVLAASVMARPGMAAVAAAGSSMGKSRRDIIWKRGHAVVGFLSGLVFGIGAMVLGQQYGRWTLNIVTLVAIPILLGIIVAARGWLGKAYRITSGRTAQ